MRRSATFTGTPNGSRPARKPSGCISARDDPAAVGGRPARPRPARRPGAIGLRCVAVTRMQSRLDHPAQVAIAQADKPPVALSASCLSSSTGSPNKPCASNSAPLPGARRRLDSAPDERPGLSGRDSTAMSLTTCAPGAAWRMACSASARCSGSAPRPSAGLCPRSSRPRTANTVVRAIAPACLRESRMD